ncbi:hypothetical protein [Methylomonas albis]|uniref:Uncharacterized protein n=1 Tax=Methylomonas albis TaxID=1854563 RepID=A0ABR9CWY1_9GAMM|nr:hypothetical protein [Methylomonas albis]MBD9355385.1 hypothetical protein [Methylomonas albis]
MAEKFSRTLRFAGVAIRGFHDGCSNALLIRAILVQFSRILVASGANFPVSPHARTLQIQKNQGIGYLASTLLYLSCVVTPICSHVWTWRSGWSTLFGWSGRIFLSAINQSLSVLPA